MRKINILSRKEFVSLMIQNNLNDTNIEEKTDLFIISIEGMSEISGEMPHYFKNNHINVLNINFDDIIAEIEGYKAIDEKQTKEIVNFIKNNLDKKQCIIHCA